MFCSVFVFVRFCVAQTRLRWLRLTLSVSLSRGGGAYCIPRVTQWRKLFRTSLFGTPAREASFAVIRRAATATRVYVRARALRINLIYVVASAL